MGENQDKTPPALQHDLDRVFEQINFCKNERAKMNANKAVQNYLAQFNPDSVERFVDEYLFYKSLWELDSKFYQDQREMNELKWIEEATKRLKYIQQKKLFDLQCQWRAETIRIPGVDVCADFTFWGSEDEIFNCPFLDPVTEEDVDLYAEFMMQSGLEIENPFEYSFIYSWQSYKEIKDAFHESEEAIFSYPDWYSFYDNHKGTGVYLSLPDIRGPKENFYRNLALDLEPQRRKAYVEMHKVFVAGMEHLTDKNGLPHINYYRDGEYFVNTFEDNSSKRHYEAFNSFNLFREEQESLSNIVYMLLCADEPINMEPHYDWKEALKNTGEQYRRRQIVAQLPEALEQYLLNLKMGIGFPKSMYSTGNAKNNIIKDILKGRKLNGEPEDLDF